jgi:ketosteroid isomerase-like protein
VSEHAEILATFDALYAAACETRDADAMVALFRTDDDVSFWGSGPTEQYFGPAELRAFADAITRSEHSFHVRWDERRVHIESNVAWVNALGAVTVDGGRALPYRVTAVLLRRDGRWLWHTHHGSEPADE